ncbi:MAG: YwaF family protein [Clostridia bacterium]|nr:YwaF family protein [Clostridia bacterium]
MNYLVCLGTIVLIACIYLIFRRFFEKHMSLTLKVFALVLAAVFLARYTVSSKSVFDVSAALSESGPEDISTCLSYITLFAVWLELSSLLVVCLYPFFPGESVFKNYAKTFALISAFINFGLLRWTTYSFEGVYLDDTLTAGAVLLAVEVGMVLCLSLHALSYGGGFHITRKEGVRMARFLPVLLFSAMMPYMFSGVLGNFGYTHSMGFDTYHRGYIYFTLLLLVAAVFCFIKCDKEFIRVSLLFASLGALISFWYQYDYTTFSDFGSWPLHLCSLMMMAVPLCLIFRWQWLFDFVLLFGVGAALIGILLPVYENSYGALSTDTVTYWLSMVVSFDFPILMCFYGIYRTPKLREGLWCLFAFFVYFAAVVIASAFMSADGEIVDFFFVSSTVLSDKLGSVGSGLYGVEFTVGRAAFQPLYELVWFVVYGVIGVLLYFFYQMLVGLKDMYVGIYERQREIKLEEYAFFEERGNMKTTGEFMNGESVDKLVVKNLYKRYGSSKRYAVTDASFEVKAGEILGFLGHNGAGKSSIIKCIVGIQPPTAGSIEINGYDVSKQSVEAKMQVGFVPDHYALYEKLTGREYINYVADLYNVSKEDRDERMEDLLEKLSMGDAIDSPIQTYSHGMKQKTAIMSALIHNPKLWILDEPLTGLDPTSIYQVKQCMIDHAAKGNIVFFSSHLIDIVEKLCTRIIMIKRGHIMVENTMDELMENNVDLEQYYLDVSSRPIEGEDEDPSEVMA